jgi:hypothetical protein
MIEPTKTPIANTTPPKASPLDEIWATLGARAKK